MWFRAWPLLLLPVAGLADSKIVSHDTGGHYDAVATEYRQGLNARLEFGNRVTIFNAGERRVYQLDLRARTWTASAQSSSPILVLAMWVRRPPSVRESGKTVNVWYETTDTGERREMFGQTASHLITRERRVADAGACSGNSETVTDGWYIVRSRPRSETFLRGDGECRDIVVTHGQRPITCYPLLETAKTASSTRRHEVLELSEKPLDRALFDPPRDFRHAPGDETWMARVESDWQQLEWAFKSWFD